MEKVKPYFPILTWAPNYQKDFLVRDLIAGITVALTVVPQVDIFLVFSNFQNFQLAQILIFFFKFSKFFKIFIF